jgi:hypothetical protein
MSRANQTGTFGVHHDVQCYPREAKYVRFPRYLSRWVPPRLGKSERCEELDWRQWLEEGVVPLFNNEREIITRLQVLHAAKNAFETAPTQSSRQYQRLVDGIGIEIIGGKKGAPPQRIRLRDAHLAALRQIGYEILASPVIRAILDSLVTSNPSRPPPLRIDIEKEMTRFVREFGGEVVSDIFGPSPPFANADYAFRAANVIAELKCLTEDKSEDRELHDAMDAVINRCIDAGRIPDPGPGQYVLQSVDMPRDVQDELYRLLAAPIRHRLMKANQQIKTTRKHLNMPSAHGLVLLANDGNFRLDPAQWAHAVDVALGRDRSAIDTVVMFTVNMLATTPLLARHVVLWMPAARKNHPRIDEVFLQRFFEGWQKHVAAVSGRSNLQFKTVGVGSLEALKFDKITSTARR